MISTSYSYSGHRHQRMSPIEGLLDKVVLRNCFPDGILRVESRHTTCANAVLDHRDRTRMAEI
jgi:hypothetical protein